MKSEKRQITEGIEMRNQERIKTLGKKENPKYLGILKEDTIKQAEIIEKVRKKYFRRTSKLIETKHCRRNLIKIINRSAVHYIRYLELFLKWMWSAYKGIRGQES